MAILTQLSLAEEFIRTILPGDMKYKLFEAKKMELERYKLRTEGFILHFENTEDEQTKAFVKLVADTFALIC